MGGAEPSSALSSTASFPKKTRNEQSSQHDDIKEDIFPTTPNEDAKLSWMKQNPGTTNQELAYMQHSRNSAVIGDVSKFDREETQVSPENAKYPDEAALEKTNTSVLVGINGSQHEQQSIPSRLPQGFCRTSQDEHDSLPLKQNFDRGFQAHLICDGESTCSIKKEVVSDTLLPAPQSEIMNLVHSLKPGKAAMRSQLRLNTDNRHCSSLSDQVSVPSSQGKILSSITVKEEPFGPQQCIDDRNHVLPNKEEKFTSTEKDVVLNPPFGGKSTSYVKKEVVLPALQCEKMDLVHSLEPGKSTESSHIKVNPDSGHCSSLPNQVTIPSSPAEKMSITVKKEPSWRQHCEDDGNHLLPNKEESFTSMEKDVVSNPQLNGESTSVKKEVVSDISLPVPQCEKLNSVCSLKPGKSAERSQLRLLNIRRCSSLSDQVMTPSSPAGALSSTVKAESLWPQHCVDDRDHALLHKEENITSMENEVVSDAQFDRENFTFSRTFEKVEKLQPRRYPDPAVQGPQSNAESAPPKVLEKGLDDYNWRKYGQKLVKGNKFIRSYYRCTSLNCEAKKQIERSSEGSKTDINYLGRHHHPKPQHKHQVTSTCQERATEKPIVIPLERKKPIVIASEPDADPMIEHCGGNRHVVLAEASRQSIATSADRLAGTVSSSHNEKDDYPEAKRKKIEIPSPDDNLANKLNNDLRHVVQTVSDVDLVNDGYRWRKYGQKLVKGNPNPRSYYRCSTSGCPAKKHVERAFHDSKFVITTYEGKHDHSVPPSRSVSQSATQVHGNMTSRDGELGPTPEERNAAVQEITCGGKTS